MQIELNQAEHSELMRLLKSCLGDTKSEVRRTHNPDMHDELVREREVLLGLIDKLNRVAA